ncbi:MAG: glycosyltransferase family 4 protein [Nitrospirota bacterium]
MTRFADFRLAFVVPRYGSNIVGGAETLARKMAERLAAEGADVCVFTTCAQSHFTWENALPQGESMESGVLVRRFLTNPRNLAAFHSIQARIVEGIRTTVDEQIRWLAESVNSDGLLDALAGEVDRFDAVFLLPYLFGTTFFGARVAGPKAVLIPCLHDEPFAKLPVFRLLFEGVGGFWFNTEAEARLADLLYGIGDRPRAVVGMGFDRDPPGDGDRFRTKFGVSGDYLLYFGRKEGGKGVPLLLEWFSRLRRSGQEEMRLVLAGDGEIHLPAEAAGSVLDLGFLDPEDKRDAVAGALAVCQLSRKESFSIVLMESWLQGRPMIVHADCPVTLEHCERSGGGLWARNAAEFIEAVSWMRKNSAGAAAMGEAGRTYVRERYAWDTVIERANAFLAGYPPIVIRHRSFVNRQQRASD